MDGKAGAEQLITKALKDETLLQALASQAKQTSDKSEE
jgi:predicted component of type VI protein secretion system